MPRETSRCSWSNGLRPRRRQPATKRGCGQAVGGPTTVRSELLRRSRKAIRSFRSRLSVPRMPMVVNSNCDVRRLHGKTSVGSVGALANARISGNQRGPLSFCPDPASDNPAPTHPAAHRLRRVWRESALVTETRGTNVQEPQRLTWTSVPVQMSAAWKCRPVSCPRKRSVRPMSHDQRPSALPSVCCSSEMPGEADRGKDTGSVLLRIALVLTFRESKMPMQHTHH